MTKKQIIYLVTKMLKNAQNEKNENIYLVMKNAKTIYLVKKWKHDENAQKVNRREVLPPSGFLYFFFKK